MSETESKIVCAAVGEDCLLSAQRKVLVALQGFDPFDYFSLFSYKENLIVLSIMKGFIFLKKCISEHLFRMRQKFIAHCTFTIKGRKIKISIKYMYHN